MVPPHNKKLVILIDDINLVSVEKTSYSKPIEFLIELMKHN